jgi:hypothetical protein
MIGIEMMRTRNNDGPDGCSSTFDTVHGKYSRIQYIFQDNTNHNTRGLCVTFGGAVDWKTRQLKPTAQLTAELRKHKREIGHLGGAQGMAWFGFCLLSSVCFLSVFQLLSV